MADKILSDEKESVIDWWHEIFYFQISRRNSSLFSTAFFEREYSHGKKQELMSLETEGQGMEEAQSRKHALNEHRMKHALFSGKFWQKKKKFENSSKI